MIYPKLQSLDSNDPEHVWYKSDTDFEIWFHAEIGTEKGADLFQFCVASPTAMARLVSTGPVSGHAYLIMNEFNHQDVVTWIEQRCAQAASQSWLHVTEKLQRWFRWEYENYSP